MCVGMARGHLRRPPPWASPSSACPPPAPETRGLFPKLPPPSGPEVLWGLGGTLRSRGGAGPTGQRPRPKQLWD